jgi:DNA-binding SARP family transcriptional activator
VDRGLHVQLFDGLRLESQHTATRHFRTQKTASLCAYLAYHLGRAHQREALIELLWPECSAAAGRASLNTALSAIRQELLGLNLLPGEVLAADRSVVELSPRLVSTDVREFERALEGARQAATAGERAGHLEAAIRVYRGELLRGCLDDWVFPEQAQLAGRFQRALRELIGFHEQAGDPGAALHYAGLAVRAEPLCEESRLVLMRLYAAQGQSTIALDHFRELTRLLRQELDRSPGEQIQALARGLTHREPVLAGAAALGAAGRSSAGPSETAPGAAASEDVSGAVPLASAFYVSRPTDESFRQALARRDSIVLIKGPYQSGKTSLLARGLQHARESGFRVAFTDLQTLTCVELVSLDSLFLWLAEGLADQLDLEVLPREAWDPNRGPSLNLRRYLRRHVIPASGGPLVWALDQADRLFGYPYSDDVFGVFRSWHNERALDPYGPWGSFTLVLAYAAEVHLFVRDLSQSPFNVGTRLELEDFSPEQIRDLNRRYGYPLQNETHLARFLALVDGHPYLVRRGLSALAEGLTDLSELESTADTRRGLFGAHLHRMLDCLGQDPELRAALGAFLQDGGPLGEDSYYRLRSAGLVVGHSPSTARPRCGLYRTFLKHHLAEPRTGHGPVPAGTK